jgi:hypothetical protein
MQPPAKGLQTRIRFQRFVQEWEEKELYVEVVGLEFEVRNWQSRVALRFVQDIGSRKGHVAKNQLFELLDGTRVIGVGKVTSRVHAEDL